MENLINVSIYGDGSRKYPHEVKAIYCNRADECELYKAGKCLRMPSLFEPYCPIGNTRVVDKSSKYAKRHYDMISTWKSNDKYNKLKRPSNQYITTVGNDLILYIPYIHIDQETLNLSDAVLGSYITVIPRERFTVEFADKLLKYRPYGFNGPIKSYQTEHIPFILKQINKVLPNVYDELIKMNPTYKEIVPNYVGKYAYINTCNRECTYDGFRFDGDYLIKDDWHSAFIPFGAKSGSLRIKVTDNMIFEITDNRQVTTSTKFM